MRVKFSDRQQADLTEMTALADSAEDNGFGLIKALLFSSDYRIDGATVDANVVPDSAVSIQPGVFVKADGKFYSMATVASANILSGAENQPANVWGTGLAADAVNPRKDIVVVSHQFVDSGSAVKIFIDNSNVQYTQTVNTRRSSAPLFAVLHGTPSATPSEPAIPSGFMKLATVDVPANATSILTANVTNNLNINIKTLEKLQFASQAQSAFSDLLHSDGVYDGVLGELAVSETAPQTMGVSIATGTALKDGVTANISTATTVPVDAASFASVAGESVTFSVDTKTLNTNGTPPHKIRAGTVVISGKTEGIDYSVNYTAGTITRLGGGSILAGGTISVNYDYYLPRIDRIELLMSNSTPQSTMGTPAQSPVAPAATPNTITLALVLVGEGATVIVDANITDARVFLPTMDELVAARGAFASVNARLSDGEADIASLESSRTTDEAAIASLQASRTVDEVAIASLQASRTTDEAAIVVLQAADVTDGAAITSLEASRTTDEAAIASLQASRTADEATFLVSHNPDGTIKPAAIPNVVTAQTDVTSLRAFGGGPYQNTGIKPMFVSIVSGSNSVDAFVLCDANASPTQVVASQKTNTGDASMFFIVLPGYYYKLTGGSTLVKWIEWT